MRQREAQKEEMTLGKFANVWAEAMADLDLSIEDQIELRAKVRKLGYAVLGDEIADQHRRSGRAAG